MIESLSSIWQGVIGAHRSAPDNFFDADDDASHAMRLVVELRRRRHAITMATLIEHPTVTMLAPVLMDRRTPHEPPLGDLWNAAVGQYDGTPRPTLVPIAVGVGRPFFFVHWGSGNITFLSQVADNFRNGRPVYGFESVGLRERRRPPLSVPAAAELYLTELYRVQPDGPYFIGGICSGCNIAFEMAHRITSDGGQVALLALVNGYRAGVRQVNAGWGLEDLYNLRMAQIGILTGASDPSLELPRTIELLKEMAWIDDDLEISDYYWHLALWAANTFAQEHYEPRQYPGPVHVFQGRAASGREIADWGPVAPLAETTSLDVDSSVELMATAEFAEIARRQTLAAIP